MKSSAALGAFLVVLLLFGFGLLHTDSTASVIIVVSFTLTGLAGIAYLASFVKELRTLATH